MNLSRHGILAVLFLAGMSSLGAQDMMSQQQPESIGLPTDVAPTPTPSLFVPVVPGMPKPATQPIPRSPVFLPADIPAPAIQSTPTTLDVLPGDAAFVVEPSPTPGAVRSVPWSPQPTPVKPAPKPAQPSVPQVSQAQITSWVGQATEKQDAFLALKAGWAYFYRNEYSSASVWFNQALEWNPGLGEASYGLALSKFQEGDLSSAEAIVNFRGDSYPKMRVLKGDITARRAVDAYEAKKYARSRDLFSQASQARPLSRNEETVLAWDYYYLKDYQKSAALFEKLYRASPNVTTAQGLYASLSRTGNYEKMDAIGTTVKGPIKSMYGTTSAATRYLDANLFIAAVGAGAEKHYKVLENYATPSAALGFMFWSKSGTEGEGKLNMAAIPVISGRIYPTNKTVVTAQISRITLNSGDLPNGAWVGKFPRTYQNYLVTPTTSYSSLFDFSVRFEYQDWISWYVTFGITPSGGPLSAKPIGNIGGIYRDQHGYVQAELYSKAVKESILSYIGMKDPYSGKNWGGVTESGASVSLFRSIAPKWTIFLNGTYGILDGTDVKQNTHVSATAAIAYEFKVKDFEYITLGVAGSCAAYENNQNHFTYGNGGYFSPETLAQIIIQGQFLTTEGRKWIAAGSLGLGVQNNRQASSPYFPLDPDGRTYPSEESSTAIGMIAAQGAYMISPQWLIGGELGYAVTANYNEGSIGFYVRYFFEPRRGLFRTDLGLDRQ